MGHNKYEWDVEGGENVFGLGVRRSPSTSTATTSQPHHV